MHVLQALLHTTGCLEFADGASTNSVFTDALKSAVEHNLEYEVLTPEEANARYPGYKIPSNFKVRLAALLAHSFV